MQEVVFRPSRVLAGVLGMVVALAVLAVALAALPWPVQAALVAGVAAVAWFAWRRERSVRRLRLPADGTLQLWLDDDWHDAEIDAASFASPLLLVLRLRGEFGAMSLTLLPDSADAESLRRLRVRIRWGRRTPRDTAARGAD